ncbi:nucleotidyltransferase family protein [Marinobacter sp. DUT-1]|uniref:nucleotidyltransferase family protein n=1 Tax=Marinobacter sp. DUT-1 TaxID=3412037 RepID=UPI003D16AF8E
MLIRRFSFHPDESGFAVIVLAAGASTRLGRPKALLKLPDGGTLLDQALRQARRLGRDVRVVTGAWYPLIRFRCHLQPSVWLSCEHWAQGLSASLATGIESLGPKVKGVFVLVADQPLLDPEALQAMSQAAWQVPNQPMAADYGGRAGVPAYLPRWLWPEVVALEGDQGAGRLLTEVGATLVPVGGIHDDVDTPSDWRRIRSLLSQTARTARQSRR